MMRQHEVVHPADASLRIPDTGRNTRPEYGHDKHVALRRIEFSRPDLCRGQIEVPIQVGRRSLALSALRSIRKSRLIHAARHL